MWQPISFSELPEDLRGRWDPDNLEITNSVNKVRHCPKLSYKIHYARENDGTITVTCWKRPKSHSGTVTKALAWILIIIIFVLGIILATQPAIIQGILPKAAPTTPEIHDNLTPMITTTPVTYTGAYPKGSVATDRIGKEGLAIANNDLAGKYLVIPVLIDASQKGWHTNGTVKAAWLVYPVVEEQYPVKWAGGIIDANHIPDRDWSLYRRNLPGNTIETVSTTPFLTAVPTSTMPPAWMTTAPTIAYYQVTTTDVEQALFLAANQERKERGLAQLAFDRDLAAVAREHSQNMAGSQFLSHVNPAGEDPAARAVRHEYPLYKDTGNGSFASGIGENIAKMPIGTVQFHCPDATRMVMTNSDSVAAAIMDSWINHDGCQGNRYHDNILDPEYERIGIGVVFDGQYYIATADFW